MSLVSEASKREKKHGTLIYLQIGLTGIKWSFGALDLLGLFKNKSLWMFIFLHFLHAYSFHCKMSMSHASI